MEPEETELEGEEKLAPLGDFVAGFVDFDGAAGEGAVTLERLVVDLPIEIDVGDELCASPPRQRVETTILPVFHQLRLTLERSDAGE